VSGNDIKQPASYVGLIGSRRSPPASSPSWSPSAAAFRRCASSR